MVQIPETMRAVALRTAAGARRCLGRDDVPCPIPAAGEILVKVAAAGVNRPDMLQRQGAYPPPPGAPDVPGLEIAGEVVGRRPGGDALPCRATRSCALVPGGGYAEYAVVHETNALPVPPDLSLVEAGGDARKPTSPSGRTCSSAAGCSAGETLLVHGGSSGIGTTAIQLAKAFGAKVIATAGIAGEMRGMPQSRRGRGRQLPRRRISSRP